MRLHGGPRNWGPLRERVLAVGLLVAAACTDLFGPDPIATPRLRELAIGDRSTALRHGGVMYVAGYPADTAFRLGSHQRVRVEVTTTSGDRENPGLRRFLCPPRELGPHFLCFDFLLLMQAGSDARGLAAEVDAAGGRFSLVSSTGSVATVTLFSSDDLVGRTRAARAWRGVAFTELVFPFCAPDASGCLARSQLEVPMPVDSGVASPGDGVIQVRSGDTVVVAYRQPTGELLQARRAVP